ncbi:MAG: DNA polymerase IV [Bacilli bacterium]|nr:DNA polymerase IV [Bacilli bacterium]
MAKVIVHIDMNAFFARCEEIKDPSLEGKPVAIGKEGRGGVVSTCSYAARKYGVHSAMPMFQAKQLCPDLIIKYPDFHFYMAMSATFINFIKKYTKKVEIASIDECYADFTNAIKGIKDVPKFFKDLQNKLFQETKLMCSIGVATTKFLAKMGSDYKKPMGLTIIHRSNIKEIIYPLTLDKMFGVGKKTAPRLESIGVKTIGDLAKLCNEEDEKVKDILGKFFYTIKDWLNGYGDDEVIVEPFDPKSIGNSTTLMHDTSSLEEINPVFMALAKEVSQRAIKEDKIGNTIQIVVKESNFKSHNKSITFSNPTNDYKTIFSYAYDLYLKNFQGLTVRLLGITLQNLINPKDMVIQMSFFDYEKHEEESATKLLINDLNRRLEKPSLMRASEVKKK